MQNSYTSSFRRYVRGLVWIQATLVMICALASVALVKYVVEPNDTFINRLELIRTGTAKNAAFGDSHIVWGITFRTRSREESSSRGIHIRFQPISWSEARTLICTTWALRFGSVSQGITASTWASTGGKSL